MSGTVSLANPHTARRVDTTWAARADDAFRAHYPSLRRRAAHIGGALLDGEDLLAEAFEGMLRQWSRGHAASSGVSGYLTRSMRNRVIDEARSPRSRVRGYLDGEEFAVEARPDFRLECAQEVAWVRKALARLPRGHRDVLASTIVDGRTPRELAAELGCTPNSLYSLNRRAKHRLRRELLRVVLEEDAPEACLDHARRLPDVVTDRLEDMSPASTAVRHAVECGRCSQAWDRFAEIKAILNG